jgi:hypothetical protein
MKTKYLINYAVKMVIVIAVNTNIYVRVCRLKKEKRMSKYKNKKVVIDNITFDSNKEGMRYLELKQKESNGQIKDLRLQVKFELQPSYKIDNKTIRAINYVCDFVYMENINGDIPSWKQVIEDVKGYRTDVYKLKKKLFEYKYGIEIEEV